MKKLFSVAANVFFYILFMSSEFQAVTASPIIRARLYPYEKKRSKNFVSKNSIVWLGKFLSFSYKKFSWIFFLQCFHAFEGTSIVWPNNSTNMTLLMMLPLIYCKGFIYNPKIFALDFNKRHSSWNSRYFRIFVSQNFKNDDSRSRSWRRPWRSSILIQVITLLKIFFWFLITNKKRTVLMSFEIWGSTTAFLIKSKLQIWE